MINYPEAYRIFKKRWDDFLIDSDNDQLDWLAQNFVEGNYFFDDMLLRVICDNFSFFQEEAAKDNILLECTEYGLMVKII